MVKLGELIQPVRSARAGDSEYPLLSMTMHNGLVDQFDKFNKRVASQDTSAYKVIERGQLVVGFPIDEGVLDFQMLYDKAIVSPAYGVWELSNKYEVSRTYLGAYLRSERAIDYYKAKLQGSTARRRSLPNSTFLALPIYLPPLDEQRRIVAILDRADAIRVKRRHMLADFDELPRSLFLKMFGDMTATKHVENVIEKMRTGPFGSDLHHDEFVDDGISVLGLDNVVGNKFQWGQRRYITSEKYEKLKRYTVYPGDVLVSIMGTAGRCVVVPDDIPTAINTKHICAISVDREVLEPLFLRAVFLWHRQARMHLLKSVKGSIMDGLNMGIIKKMPVITPPLPLQREFARRVEAIAAARAKVERALALDDELFASLQSRAFRGEL